MRGHLILMSVAVVMYGSKCARVNCSSPFSGEHLCVCVRSHSLDSGPAHQHIQEFLPSPHILVRRSSGRRCCEQATLLWSTSQASASRCGRCSQAARAFLRTLRTAPAPWEPAPAPPDPDPFFLGSVLGGAAVLGTPRRGDRRTMGPKTMVDSQNSPPPPPSACKSSELDENWSLRHELTPRKRNWA